MNDTCSPTESKTLADQANNSMHPNKRGKKSFDEMTPEELARAESLAKYRWTGIIIAFFFIQAVIWSFAIVMTHNDPSHAVAKEYNNQTMSWNEQRELLAASQALGWQATATVSEFPDALGNRVFGIQLVDREGKPIADANVKATVFHQARANEEMTFVMNEAEPGLYVATGMINRKGTWRIACEATQGDKKFVWDERLYLDFASMKK